MSNRPRQKAVELDFEQAMADDGVLALTVWFAGPGQPYFSMACSDEDPAVVYIESEDQIHGFETTGLRFVFEPGPLLVLALADGRAFPATTDSRLAIEIDPDDEPALRERFALMRLKPAR